MFLISPLSRGLIFAVALSLLSTVSLLTYMPYAQACSPGDPSRVEIVEDDTPNCLDIRPTWESHISISSACDDDVELEAIECDGQCDTNIIVAAGEQNLRVVLENRDPYDFADGEFVRQNYHWEMDGESGRLETEVHFRDTSGDCMGIGGCTGTGGGTPSVSVLLFVFALAALALRRDMLAVTDRRRRRR